MTTEEKEKFKKKLTSIKKDLDYELRKIEKDLDFGDDVEGSTFDEETDEAEERANTLPVSAELNERLEAVSEALSRIKEGTYGICVKCGSKIEEAVLNAAPESALCSSCKQAKS